MMFFFYKNTELKRPHQDLWWQAAYLTLQLTLGEIDMLKFRKLIYKYERVSWCHWVAWLQIATDYWMKNFFIITTDIFIFWNDK